MNEEVLANHTLVCAGKSTMIYQTSRSIYYFIFYPLPLESCLGLQKTSGYCETKRIKL